MHLFGRVREPERDGRHLAAAVLTRAADDTQHTEGPGRRLRLGDADWLMEHDYIEAAMVSGVEADDAWKAKPVLVAQQGGGARHGGQPLHLLRQPAGAARGQGARA